GQRLETHRERATGPWRHRAAAGAAHNELVARAGDVRDLNWSIAVIADRHLPRPALPAHGHRSEDDSGRSNADRADACAERGEEAGRRKRGIEAQDAVVVAVRDDDMAGAVNRRILRMTQCGRARSYATQVAPVGDEAAALPPDDVGGGIAAARGRRQLE